MPDSDESRLEFDRLLRLRQPFRETSREIDALTDITLVDL